MITSKENALIKHVKSLSQKKYRDEYKEYIVEGYKMVLEALVYAKVSTIIVSDAQLESSLLDRLSKSADKKNVKIEYASSKVFDSISDTTSPQGVLAIVKQEESNLNNCLKEIQKDKTIYALDKLQDPGNLGTIIRTLDSAGIKHLILSKDSADPYNPKVVRSTMGAIFRLNIYRIEEELSKKLLSLKDKGFKIVTTSLDTNKYYYGIDFEDNLVIVIGNESQGVSEEVQNISDIKVKIPMVGKTESLNAAVAASIIAYEKVRQTVTKE